MDLNNIDLPGVVAWARSKPADATFVFVSNRHCFFAQYLRDVHKLEASVTTSDFWLLADPRSVYDVPEPVQTSLHYILVKTLRDGIKDKELSFHTVANDLEARLT